MPGAPPNSDISAFVRAWTSGIPISLLVLKLRRLDLLLLKLPRSGLREALLQALCALAEKRAHALLVDRGRGGLRERAGQPEQRA